MLNTFCQNFSLNYFDRTIENKTAMMNKIEIDKERDLGEIIKDSILFFRQNFSKLFFCSLVIVSHTILCVKRFLDCFKGFVCLLATCNTLHNSGNLQTKTKTKTTTRKQRKA